LVLLFSADGSRSAVYLGDIARVDFISASTEIRRESQSRIIEVNAALIGDRVAA
jgi:hypothetical protein